MCSCMHPPVESGFPHLKGPSHLPVFATTNCDRRLKSPVFLKCEDTLVVFLSDHVNYNKRKGYRSQWNFTPVTAKNKLPTAALICSAGLTLPARVPTYCSSCSSHSRGSFVLPAGNHWPEYLVNGNQGVTNARKPRPKASHGEGAFADRPVAAAVTATRGLKV